MKMLWQDIVIGHFYDSILISFAVFKLQKITILNTNFESIALEKLTTRCHRLSVIVIHRFGNGF